MKQIRRRTIILLIKRTRSCGSLRSPHTLGLSPDRDHVDNNDNEGNDDANGNDEDDNEP